MKISSTLRAQVLNTHILTISLRVQGLGFRVQGLGFRVQGLGFRVPNNHILTQHLYFNYCYPNPKYRIIGYMDPQGSNAEAELRSNRTAAYRLHTPGHLRDYLQTMSSSERS